jgi:hypothetical protein
MKLKQIQKIISGGQTGVDRAAFDFALDNGIEIGGFVPHGRRAEDGKVPAKYPNLIETKTRNYSERTELNVQNSDATLIISHGKLTGGSKLTRVFAKRNRKPFLHLDFEKMTLEKAIQLTQIWLISNDCKKLNIAGPRASTDAEIYPKTLQFLGKLFGKK